MDYHRHISVFRNTIRAVIDIADRQPGKMEQILQIEVFSLYKRAGFDILRDLDRGAGPVPA